MTKPFSHIGVWWLPSSPDHQTGGVLRYSRRGLRLELAGEADGTDDGEPEFRSIPIILGVIKGKGAVGGLVTLSNCLGVALNVHMSGTFFQTYLVQVAYFGSHFEQVEQLRFKSGSIEFTHLDAWCFRPRRHTLRQSKLRRVFRVSYKPPESLKVQLKHGILSVTQFANASYSWQAASVSEHARIWIQSEEPLGLQTWYAKWITPFEHFLNLATDRLNSPTTLTLSSDDRQPVHVVHQSKFRRVPKRHDVGEEDFLFSFQNIRRRFRTAMTKWFDRASDMHVVCSLLFGAMREDWLFLEQRFLNLMFAAEAYHRRRYDRPTVSERVHRERRRAVMQVVRPKDRKWLEAVLSSSNRLSLHHRLVDLLNRTRDVTDALVPERNRFLRMVVDARNYWTHQFPSSGDKLPKGEELLLLCDVLGYMLKRCLLNEIGLPGATCHDLFSRNSMYRQTVYRASQRFARR